MQKNFSINNNVSDEDHLDPKLKHNDSYNDPLLNDIVI